MSDLTDFYSSLGSKQRDRRVKRFYTDQFGRRYFAWADKDNQRPIGEFVLADKTGQFVTAPWNPPMGYMEWLDKDGLEFKWEFEKVASELAGITAEWYSNAQILAQAAHLPIPDVGGDCHPTLIGLMGTPPLSPEVPMACHLGEPWILGYKDAPLNKRLQTLIHLGRTLTSTYALETIRRRVQAMIEGGETNLQTLVETTKPDPSVVIPPPSEFYQFMADQIKAGVSKSEAMDLWRARKSEAA